MVLFRRSAEGFGWGGEKAEQYTFVAQFPTPVLTGSGSAGCLKNKLSASKGTPLSYIVSIVRRNRQYCNIYLKKLPNTAQC